MEFRVGEPFPGEVDLTYGARLEIGPLGTLNLCLQYKWPRLEEFNAIETGFTHYSYLETQDTVTLGTFVFKFASPIGHWDAPFHAARGSNNCIELFLAKEECPLIVCQLEDEIVRDVWMTSLHPDAAAQFKATIRKQLTENALDSTYYPAVEKLQLASPKELYRRGQQFMHTQDELLLPETDAQKWFFRDDDSDGEA